MQTGVTLTGASPVSCFSASLKVEYWNELVEWSVGAETCGILG